MKHFKNQFIIITNMTDLCRFLQKETIEVIGIEAIKGVYNEDVAKVEYKYREKEDLA